MSSVIGECIVGQKGCDCRRSLFEFDVCKDFDISLTNFELSTDSGLSRTGLDLADAPTINAALSQGFLLI